ncbi:hypothetical protein ColTof4_03918 [Colletotrichum tofieldiae]|uniref:Uncharacterized protein n=2 Tax=Colletotrichum spaethianum species complex TaxID=2707349 RepID=A0A166XG97_9PEZI|nr:hypothetical protein CT0861_05725 [Colletotrichum tofieldiae]GJC85529.1 hypothetical protein ColLi_08367 [Colletotrichum liriopes]GKT66426.1 hypothetical protein ColTof3_13765 [Colletotrichum tofieldiae]GKT71495.1 hypothetical protein ColTof4_03918 [Colletotrichum tofieldiae]
MQILSMITFAVLAAGVTADLHHQAVCVKNRVESPVGGTPWSVSYTWSNNYEILADATKCACDYYKNRNTGSKQWDQCPDCEFDGMTCNSKDWHIGGDEMNYYCTKKCGAEGAEAN